MNIKKVVITIAVAITLILGFLLCKQIFTDEYKPADDEISLHVQMDTKEDIGLLVFDYYADGVEFSGGISNADKTLIKNSDDIVIALNKQELNSSYNDVKLEMYFRIITEYTEPNYENIYPENITQYIDTPVSWKASFGEEYFITITGDKANGYKAVLN